MLIYVFGVNFKVKKMSNPITLAQKKFIEKHSELGFKSPEIAEQLGVSVWTVRKWGKRIKKGAH